MGKLFWKFFFGFWLCLIAAALATGTVLYLLRDKPANADIAEGPRAQFMLETMQAVLEGKGPQALKELIDRNRFRSGNPVPVYAVSQGGRELLGRDIPENLREQVAATLEGLSPVEGGFLLVNAQDGSRWLLFIPRSRPQHAAVDANGEPPASQAGPRHSGSSEQGNKDTNRRNTLEPPLSPFEWPGMVAALLASLLFAGALAYTFSRPLNRLKHAFRQAARGQLGVRIGGQGKRVRTDEIGELLQGFDHMAQEIENRIAQQQNLLHDVSHELRSPLARLNLAVGLARQNPSELDKSLRRIESEAERLDELIGELLHLSRLESGQQPQELATMNVVELLHAVVDDAQFEAEQLGKSVLLGCTSESFDWPCEPLILQRAFDNIIRNAIKHTPEGGRVWVTCQPVSHKAGGRSLRIEVQDEGPGVPEALLPKLVTPFFKHGPQAGHGLGLAIAQRAIQWHNGSLFLGKSDKGGLLARFELGPGRMA